MLSTREIKAELIDEIDEKPKPIESTMLAEINVIDVESNLLTVTKIEENNNCFMEDENVKIDEVGDGEMSSVDSVDAVKEKEFLDEISMIIQELTSKVETANESNDEILNDNLVDENLLNTVAKNERSPEPKNEPVSIATSNFASKNVKTEPNSSESSTTDCQKNPPLPPADTPQNWRDYPNKSNFYYTQPVESSHQNQIDTKFKAHPDGSTFKPPFYPEHLTKELITSAKNRRNLPSIFLINDALKQCGIKAKAHSFFKFNYNFCDYEKNYPAILVPTIPGPLSCYYAFSYLLTGKYSFWKEIKNYINSELLKKVMAKRAKLRPILKHCVTAQNFGKFSEDHLVAFSMLTKARILLYTFERRCIAYGTKFQLHVNKVGLCQEFPLINMPTLCLYLDERGNYSVVQRIEICL